MSRQNDFSGNAPWFLNPFEEQPALWRRSDMRKLQVLGKTRHQTIGGPSKLVFVRRFALPLEPTVLKRCQCLNLRGKRLIGQGLQMMCLRQLLQAIPSIVNADAP